MEIGLSQNDTEERSLDTVLNFQKSAIYRQCLEYKRLYHHELENSKSLNSKMETLELLLSQVLNLGKFSLNNLQEISSLEQLKNLVLNAQNKTNFDNLSELKQKNISLERQINDLSRKYDEIFSENLKLHRKIERNSLKPQNTVLTVQKEENQVQKQSTNLEISDKKLLQEIESLKEDLRLKQENLDIVLEEKKNLALKITDLTAKDILNQKDGEKISELELHIADLKQQVQVNKEKYLKSLDKIQDIEGKEREFHGIIIKEEQEKRKKISSDLKRMEGDNARLRKERDSYKHKYDLKCVKDGEESKVLQELHTLMNCQKERIQTLEMDISRLLGLVAHESGDKVLEDFFKLNGAKNPIQFWESQVQESQSRIKDLEDIIAKSSASDWVFKEKEWLEKERNYLSKIENLEMINQKFHNFSETDAGCSLVSKDQEISELKNKIEYFNKAQAGLLKEIENLGKSWADLEAQNTKKILNLSSIEELKIKHKEDKVKLEHKCSLLTRQSATVDNARIALKKQCEKQSEMIIKQQEREKAVSEQLVSLEKENAARAKLLEAEKLTVSDLMAQVNRLEAQNNEINKRCENMLSLVRSRSEALELESASKMKIQEQVASLTKKLDIINKDGDANLREQLQDYKLLLKCSSCNNRFKTHVLLKCMHVFCKECLDDMYNSRQRKCPSCSLPFGQLDMKQIFL